MLFTVLKMLFLFLTNHIATSFYFERGPRPTRGISVQLFNATQELSVHQHSLTECPNTQEFKNISTSSFEWTHVKLIGWTLFWTPLHLWILLSLQPCVSKSIFIVLKPNLNGDRSACRTLFSCLLWCTASLWTIGAPAECKIRSWWLSEWCWENVTDYIRAPTAKIDRQGINMGITVLNLILVWTGLQHLCLSLSLTLTHTHTHIYTPWLDERHC